MQVCTRVPQRARGDNIIGKLFGNSNSRLLGSASSMMANPEIKRRWYKILQTKSLARQPLTRRLVNGSTLSVGHTKHGTIQGTPFST
jgi:hypothetical protein